MIKISMVPSEQIDAVWDVVEPMLQRALDTNPGKYMTIDLYTDVVMHRQVLWIAFDHETAEITAACISRVIEYPMSRALLIEWVAGMDAVQWLDLGQEIFSCYARDMGCKTMECQGRRGWTPYVKKYGWEPRAVHFVYELKD